MSSIWVLDNRTKEIKQARCILWAFQNVGQALNAAMERNGLLWVNILETQKDVLFFSDDVGCE